MQGNIISLRDEAGGGWIVRNREVVNEEKWNEYVNKEKDKLEAAKAVTQARVREDFPEQPVSQEPDRVGKLETELAEMKEMLKQALGK